MSQIRGRVMLTVYCEYIFSSRQSSAACSQVWHSSFIWKYAAGFASAESIPVSEDYCWSALIAHTCVSPWLTLEPAFRSVSNQPWMGKTLICDVLCKQTHPTGWTRHSKVGITKHCARLKVECFLEFQSERQLSFSTIVEKPPNSWQSRAGVRSKWEERLGCHWASWNLWHYS